MMSGRISAVLNTLNEERNLPNALRSVRPWVDEIVVVDMHSTDGTVAIARRFGAVVYQHEPLGFADPARPFAVSRANGDWILLLDADELVTKGLASRLLQIVDENATDVVWVPLLNYVFGSTMRATGWGPDQAAKLRFFRRGMVEFAPTIHAFMAPADGARAVTIPYSEGVALVHFNYASVRQFIEKTNRYTDIEADQAIGSGGSAGVGRLLWAPIREFVKLYFWHGGYRDGWRGLELAILMAFYRFASVAKLRERRMVGTESEIAARYVRVADQWLAGTDRTPHS